MKNMKKKQTPTKQKTTKNFITGKVSGTQTLNSLYKNIIEVLSLESLPVHCTGVCQD